MKLPLLTDQERGIAQALEAVVERERERARPVPMLGLAENRVREPNIRRRRYLLSTGTETYRHILIVYPIGGCS